MAKKCSTKYKDTVLPPIKVIDRYKLPTCCNGYDVWQYNNFLTLYNNEFPFVGTLKLFIPASHPYTLDKDTFIEYIKQYRTIRWGAQSTLISRVTDNIKKDIGLQLNITPSIGLHMTIMGRAYPEPVTLQKFYFPAVTEEYTVLENSYDISKLGDIIHTSSDLDIVQYLYVSGRVTNVVSYSLQHYNNKKVNLAKVFISLKGNFKIKLDSLLRYIISFRYEDHTQETVITKMYNYFHELLGDSLEDIGILGAYAENDNLLIFPVRYKINDLCSTALQNVTMLTKP